MAVTATNVQDSSAIIQWTVSSIAYTPETYVVEYGTSQDSLDMTSDPTHSGEDITVVNQMYLVQLSNLEPVTQYYYQVVATNTALSHLSTPHMFTTLNNCKYLLGIFKKGVYALEEYNLPFMKNIIYPQMQPKL